MQSPAAEKMQNQITQYNITVAEQNTYTTVKAVNFS